MIDLCCTACAKGTHGIKLVGMTTLIHILKLFMNVADPDVPDEPLLQQHTMKFSTAISHGFESKSSPELMRCSALLASMFIPSTMVTNQPKTMIRNLQLLTSFKLDEPLYDYGEIASTMVKLSVLQSLARIYTDSESFAPLVEQLQPHLHHLSVLWNGALLDYAHLLVLWLMLIMFITPTNAPSSSSTGSSKKPSLELKFLEPGTEQDCFKFYTRAYPTIMEATCRFNHHHHDDNTHHHEKDWMLLGIAVHGLQNQIMDGNNHHHHHHHHHHDNKRRTDKSDHKQMNITLHLLNAIKHLLISNNSFMMHHKQAPTALFEICILLVRIQTRREMDVQLNCLNLLDAVLNQLSGSYFDHAQVPVQSMVATALEVCLKPLYLHFPVMFEMMSEKSFVLHVDKQQLQLIQQVCKCMSSLLSRFGPHCVHSQMIHTLVYSVVRMVEFCRIVDPVHVVIRLSELTRIVPKHHAMIWNDAIQQCMVHLENRIEQYQVCSGHEIEMYIVIACCDLSDSSLLLDRVEKRIRTHLNRVVDLKSARMACWMLEALQNALLHLARSNSKLEKIALDLLSKLTGCMLSLLCNVFKDSKLSNDDFESDGEGDGGDVQVVVNMVQTTLNILLTLFALIDEKNVDKRTGFLCLLVPVLVLVLRCESKFDYDENNIHTVNVNKIHKLAVTCLERIAASAATEFRQLIQNVLPANIIVEIQQAAKKGAANKPKQKVKQQVKKEAEKLTFDFKI
ncbi:heatr5b [Acrasis kona]|uniref:Heatr5b n=1 Tax=Acrasis kona TaxID=1008807 RepID=A0AAW2Z9L3_9EUKA